MTSMSSLNQKDNSFKLNKKDGMAFLTEIFGNVVTPDKLITLGALYHKSCISAAQLGPKINLLYKNVVLGGFCTATSICTGDVIGGTIGLVGGFYSYQEMYKLIAKAKILLKNAMVTEVFGLAIGYCDLAFKIAEFFETNKKIKKYVKVLEEIKKQHVEPIMKSLQNGEVDLNKIRDATMELKLLENKVDLEMEYCKKRKTSAMISAAFGVLSLAMGVVSWNALGSLVATTQTGSYFACGMLNMGSAGLVLGNLAICKLTDNQIKQLREIKGEITIMLAEFDKIKVQTEAIEKAVKKIKINVNESTDTVDMTHFC